MLSDNIWWTRQARIRTERRLLSNAFHSQVILLWYSFFSVAVSIYYVSSSQPENSGKYWIIYSVLVLVVSGFINGFSYKERAMLIKESYESLKTLEVKAKEIEKLQGDLADVARDYEAILKKCENHEPKDYSEALYDNYHSTADRSKLSLCPTEYQLNQAKKNREYRVLALLALYSLPVFICLFANAKGIVSVFSTILAGCSE
ncbi:SLATT domain-containing protein [Vibrio sp. 16]|uniref:SLATT domain-containing protein n=1 Tax=Vibrio sp. 16 TaxID=391586 RepID=UPI002FF01DBC